MTTSPPCSPSITPLERPRSGSLISEPMGPAYILNLPLELIEMIASYLTTKKIYHLSLTCHCLYKFLQKTLLKRVLAGSSPRPHFPSRRYYAQNTILKTPSAIHSLILTSTSPLVIPLINLLPSSSINNTSFEFGNKNDEYLLRPHSKCSYWYLSTNSRHGATLLQTAVVSGIPSTVSHLLSLGADPNLRYNADCCISPSPLFHALLTNNTEIANLLLDAGADGNHLTGAGFNSTPLSAASCAGNLELFHKVLAVTSEETINNSGCAALVEAAHHGELEMFVELVRRGVWFPDEQLEGVGIFARMLEDLVIGAHPKLGRSGRNVKTVHALLNIAEEKKGPGCKLYPMQLENAVKRAQQAWGAVCADCVTGNHGFEEERQCGWALRARMWGVVERMKMKREVRALKGLEGIRKAKRSGVEGRRTWEGLGLGDVDWEKEDLAKEKRDQGLVRIQWEVCMKDRHDIYRVLEKHRREGGRLQ